MTRLLPLVFLGLILSGCLNEPDPAGPDSCTGPSVENYEGSPEGWREERLSHGKHIYAEACASCHDPGAGPAPTIGRQDEWSDRSRLWCAVLFEHAGKGYLDMPAKGGDPGLMGKDVDAAAEYMLSVTFPELPID